MIFWKALRKPSKLHIEIQLHNYHHKARQLATPIQSSTERDLAYPDKMKVQFVRNQKPPLKLTINTYWME